MKPGTPEERFGRILNWMLTNLEVSSAVYRRADGTLGVDPGVTVSALRQVTRVPSVAPADFAGWELNSSSALVACCYIDALGKVLKKGTGTNLKRFRAFVTAYMPDLVRECQEKRGNASIKRLFIIYRCGFVHQFADVAAHWDRLGPNEPYWAGDAAEPILNVDRFVQGVLAGIRRFREAFSVDPSNGPNPYQNFYDWLTARRLTTRCRWPARLTRRLLGKSQASRQAAGS